MTLPSSDMDSLSTSGTVTAWTLAALLVVVSDTQDDAGAHEWS